MGFLMGADGDNRRPVVHLALPSEALNRARRCTLRSHRDSCGRRLRDGFGWFSVAASRLGGVHLVHEFRCLDAYSGGPMGRAARPEYGATMPARRAYGVHLRWPFVVMGAVLRTPGSFPPATVTPAASCSITSKHVDGRATNLILQWLEGGANAVPDQRGGLGKHVRTGRHEGHSHGHCHLMADAAVNTTTLFDARRRENVKISTQRSPDKACFSDERAEGMCWNQPGLRL
jgi:hypothetical protein